MATQNQDDGVKFGKYDGEDLWWDVLWEDDYKRLLMCRSYFESYLYECQRIWNTWDRRKYFNQEFFNMVFSENEKKYIVNSYLEDTKTKDNIFILSTEEMNRFIKEKHFNGKRPLLSRTVGTYRSNYNDCLIGVKRYSSTWNYQSYTYPCLYLKK